MFTNNALKNKIETIENKFFLLQTENKLHLQQINDLTNNINNINTQLKTVDIVGHIKDMMLDVISNLNYITEKDLVDNLSTIIDQQDLDNAISEFVTREELSQILETVTEKLVDAIEDSISERLNNLNFSNIFKLYILKLLNIKG